MDAGAVKDLKSGLSPGFQEINMIGSDLVLRKMQGKDFRSPSSLAVKKLAPSGTEEWAGADDMILNTTADFLWGAHLR